MAKTILYESQELFGFITDFYRDDEGNFYMTRRQLAQCLGYEDENGVLKVHKRYEKYMKEHCKYIFVQVPQSQSGRVPICHPSTPQPNSDKGSAVVTYQRRKTYLYDEEGIYFIAMKSDQPIALEFTMRVAKILKQLRKGYQVWFLQREIGKKVRRSLTDVIKDCVPDSPHKKFAYKNYTDLVYKTVTGMDCKELKAKYEVPADGNIRDKLPKDLLDEVSKAEDFVKSLVAYDYTYQEIKDILSKKYLDTDN